MVNQRRLKIMLETQFPARPKMEVFAKWLMFTCCILFLGFMAAYYPVEANIPFIVIPSILVLLFAKPVFFEKLKLTTLLVMRIVIVFAFFFIEMRQIYVDLILLALIINILEATFTDLLKHKKYFNAISGFMLAAGVVGLRGGWVDGAGYYLVSGANQAATICYVIGYTIWNWIFVTDEFSPAVSLMHVGFLGAPILGGLVSMAFGNAANPMGIWLLLRANTLAIGGWLQIACKGWFEKEFYDEKFAKFIDFTHKNSVQFVLMLINVGLMIAVIAIAATTHGFIGSPAFER